MNTLSLNAPDAAALAAGAAAAPAVAARPASARLLVAMAGLWLGLWLFQSVAEWGDAVRQGRPADLAALLGSNLPLYLPWLVFSAVLSMVLDRRLHRLTQPRTVMRTLALATLLFYLPYVGYEVLLLMWQNDVPLARFAATVRRYPVITLFIDYVLFLGCFASLYAVAVFRGSLATERQQRRTESENLALRLSLERHRLVLLQAQLEPHFLFNALSAIGSLVRAADQRAALGGLARLSELLRYALAAGSREQATLGEELDFVRDYLALQHLRYGERLQLVIDGEDGALRACSCPPLLLQPLVENALRHDLDCHDGHSVIHLRLRRGASRVEIDIDNGVRSGLAPNPGLGLGLRNTRDRLALLYHGRAQLETQRSATRFNVRLSLPCDDD